MRHKVLIEAVFRVEKSLYGYGTCVSVCRSNDDRITSDTRRRLDIRANFINELCRQGEYVEANDRDGLSVALQNQCPSEKIIMDALAKAVTGGKACKGSSDRRRNVRFAKTCVQHGKLLERPFVSYTTIGQPLSYLAEWPDFLTARTLTLPQPVWCEEGRRYFFRECCPESGLSKHLLQR